MLPRCILANPVNGKHINWRESVKMIKNRISRWRSGDITGLWSDYLSNDKMPRGRGKGHRIPPHQDALRGTNARRAKRAVEAGQYRKAIQALIYLRLLQKF